MSNDIDRAEPSSHGRNAGPDPSGTTESSRESHGFEERLSAVERALTGSDATVAEVEDEAEATAERDALADRLDELESRVEELEAATQALRGYAGSIRAVNREVERRADLALARASDGGGATGREERDDHRRRDASEGAVPSESALDAALPSDSTEGDGIENNGIEGDGFGSDGIESEAEEGESWGTDALERLRESV